MLGMDWPVPHDEVLLLTVLVVVRESIADWQAGIVGLAGTHNTQRSTRYPWVPRTNVSSFLGSQLGAG